MLLLHSYYVSYHVFVYAVSTNEFEMDLLTFKEPDKADIKSMLC